jgi:predicted enzyme related to lactoylglutathione lyase
MNTNQQNPFPRMHVSLYVSDLNQSVAFYNQFFGQEPVKVKSGYAKYVLEKPSLIISFVENPEQVQANFGHLGFQVETVEELNERLWKARGQGIVSKEETGTNCCYAKQTLTERSGKCIISTKMPNSMTPGMNPMPLVPVACHPSPHR